MHEHISFDTRTENALFIFRGREFQRDAPEEEMLLNKSTLGLIKYRLFLEWM